MQNQYSAKKEYKPVNDKAIIPLTLYQINEQLKEDSTFDGQSFNTLSIVGRLENFRRENNANMFLFSDGTGQIEGRINLTSGKMPGFAEGTIYEDKYGSYFFVVFKPKFSEGEKKFYIQMIKEIDNYNTISKHMSDVILSSLIRMKNNWASDRFCILCRSFSQVLGVVRGWVRF